jgi:hypothetical protein
MTMPPPPPGWQPGPPPRPSGDGALLAGMAATGAALFIAVNAVVGFFVLLGAVDSSTGNTVVAIAAVGSALVAFGGGTLLILTKNTIAKGMGMGLMIGWALVTVCTVGFCTGVNPSLYGSAAL